jgi:outer membrane protein assembly factor BamB
LAQAENWPRWRGPQGNAFSSEVPLPTHWSTTDNVAWKVQIPGEGFSSPIVWGDRVFVTSALEHGFRRAMHCLDAASGRIVWSREIEDDNPEVTSAMTGHAAATPATDGRHVVAFFGNAGVVCYDFDGEQLWQRDFGDFESELGLASSPVIDGDRVILVCDHDGTRFTSFDSFLISLELETGATRWKRDRPGLFRSWSTPIFVPSGAAGREIIVNAQDELRAYDPNSGELLWRVGGMTGWVTPSPVFAHGMLFATSGRDGPTIAVRPGGRGDVTESHVAWSQARGAPYVCSPVAYSQELYVHTEGGILRCYDARSGKLHYAERLPGRFTASSVAGDGKVYVTNEDGATMVVRAGPEFELLAENRLEEYTLASPAIARGRLYVRTEKRLYAITAGEQK